MPESSQVSSRPGLKRLQRLLLASTVVLAFLAGLAVGWHYHRYRAARTVESARREVDLCVFGGSSGGVVAAVKAARMGKHVTLLAQGAHVGGMSSGGLGITDTGLPGTIGGLAMEFYTRVGKHYGVATPVFEFEPHVAEAVFQEMLAEAGVDVRFSQDVVAVTRRGHRITEIATQDGSVFRAKFYLDASYEGDLMASAGVRYVVGREGAGEYGEWLAGVRFAGEPYPFLEKVDPYVSPGNPSSGLLSFVEADAGQGRGAADDSVQAYTFRLCLTRNPANRTTITAPAGYDPGKYELLRRYIAALDGLGKTLTLDDFMHVQPVPGGKTDINSRGAFSTDAIGLSRAYVDATPDVRKAVWDAHRQYVQGFLYFLANDQQVPAALRSVMREYGLCKDEFQDNGGWPYQLYVREGRRMVSDYVVTQVDCEGGRVAPDSVGLASYAIDSHYCRRVARDHEAVNEGSFFLRLHAPYPISYRSIVPKKADCENLLVTFALSASHVAFGSLRMEPVFMITSESAATAAALAIDAGVAIQDVDYQRLSARLRADGQVLGEPASGAPEGAPSAAGVAAFAAVTSSASTTDTAPAPKPESVEPGFEIDDADRSRVALTGVWTQSVSSKHFFGTGYIHDGNSEKGAKSVRFALTALPAGRYDVYLRWTADKNRATNVPVDIESADGTTTILVNERDDGGRWVKVATAAFDGGIKAAVVIRTTGTDGFVVADGVRLVPAKPAR
jgi:hypothetical protein